MPAPTRLSHEREQELFSACLALDAAEQAAYLARECGADPQLQERLHRLLAAHGRAEGATLNPLGQFIEAAAQLAPDAPPADSSGEGPSARAGDAVGPYRLLRHLAEGGMGSVWLAERSDGMVNRPIALKLPRGPWRRASLAARMAQEREILAALSHPNIARLYDAGPDVGRTALPGARIRGGPPHRRVLPRQGPRPRRAPRPLRPGGQRRGPCEREAGRAPRPEAREHPGQRRRAGAPARLRDRAPARGRPRAGERGDARLGPDVYARLRVAGADRGRADHRRLRRLFARRHALRAAHRRAPLPAEARHLGRARGRDPSRRAGAAERSGAGVAPPRAARRPRHDRAQGAEEEARGALPDRQRAGRRRRALPAVAAGARAAGHRRLPAAQVRPPQPPGGGRGGGRPRGRPRRRGSRRLAGAAGARPGATHRGGEGLPDRHPARHQSLQLHEPGDHRARPAPAGARQHPSRTPTRAPSSAWTCSASWARACSTSRTRTARRRC